MFLHVSDQDTYPTNSGLDCLGEDGAGEDGIGTCARLTSDMGVMNLEMADHEIKGLYQFLDRECASRLFAGRFEYINKESDMGLPGLRQSKRSYNPDFRVRCFKLSLKNQ